MRDHGGSRSRAYELLARFRTEGDTPFEPRSRRPQTSPAQAECLRSSFIRLEATPSNECWQSDFTHYRLTRPTAAPTPDVEIMLLVSTGTSASSTPLPATCFVN